MQLEFSWSSLDSIPSLCRVCVCVCARTCMCALSCIQIFVTPWTVDHQAPLSLEVSRRESWNGLPFPPPGHLPVVGTNLVSLPSPALAGGLYLLHHWEASHSVVCAKQTFATTFSSEMMAQGITPGALRPASRRLQHQVHTAGSSRQLLFRLRQPGWCSGDSGWSLHGRVQSLAQSA